MAKISALVAIAAVAERCAVLETYHKQTRADMDELKDGVGAMSAKLDKMALDMAKHKGAWGAVTLVISALWLVVTQFGGAIAGFFQRH